MKFVNPAAIASARRRLAADPLPADDLGWQLRCRVSDAAIAEVREFAVLNPGIQPPPAPVIHKITNGTPANQATGSSGVLRATDR
jgi:hypothetical protein